MLENHAQLDEYFFNPLAMPCYIPQHLGIWGVSITRPQISKKIDTTPALVIGFDLDFGTANHMPMDKVRFQKVAA